MKKTFLVALVAGAVCFSAKAETLTSWTLSGLAGNEEFVAPGFSALGIEGLDMTRGMGLAASGALNSFSSSGWTGEDTDFISFGFEVGPDLTVDLTTLTIATRASNTGPGTLGLFYSGDSFAEPLFTFQQDGSNYNNQIIDLTALTDLSGSVEFRLVQIGTNSANGGTTGSGGTFRVSEYYDGAEYFAVSFDGSVVPEPGTVALVGLGISAVLFGVRRRKR